MSRLLIATFVVAGAAAWALAESNDFGSQMPHNWHQWRGPFANGVAPHGNPPLEWDEHKNIQWKLDIPGDSTATPIIWGDRIFVLSAVETDEKGQPFAGAQGRGQAPSN